MEIRRTVPVKLTVSDDDAESLHATITEFQQAANYVVSQARNDNGYVETSKQRLHERTYQDVRDQTDLYANLVQAADRGRQTPSTASSPAGKTARRPAYRRSLPIFSTTTNALRRSTTITPLCTLATVDGRIHAAFILPGEDDRAASPHGVYLQSDEYEIGGASLHYHECDDTYYLHVRTKTDVDETDHAEHPTVLGVDSRHRECSGHFDCHVLGWWLSELPPRGIRARPRIVATDWHSVGTPDDQTDRTTRKPVGRRSLT